MPSFAQSRGSAASEKQAPLSTYSRAGTPRIATARFSASARCRLSSLNPHRNPVISREWSSMNAKR